MMFLSILEGQMLLPDEYPINWETQRFMPAFFVKLFLFLFLSKRPQIIPEFLC